MTRHPQVTANASATIDELSGGRAFVGIGTGGPWGKPQAKRCTLKELRDAVEFIKKFTAGEEVVYKGMKMQSEYSRRQLPVYIACGGPKSCQLAGQVADGVIATSNADLTIAKWRMEQVGRGAERVGRDPAEIDYWVRGMIYITDSKEQARKEVAGYAVNGAYLTWVLLRQSNPEIEDLRRLVDVRPVNEGGYVPAFNLSGAQQPDNTLGEPARNQAPPRAPSPSTRTGCALR